MKLQLFILSACCVLAPAVAQAESVLSQSYAIGDVSFVEARNTAEVELRQGEQPSLTVEATSDVLRRVIVHDEGDRLVLSVKDERWGPFGMFGGNNNDALFKVQLPRPSGIKLTGVSRAEVEAVKADAFTIDISGASEANLAGLSVGTLDLRARGSSHVYIHKLHGEEMLASISGSSHVIVRGQSHMNKLDLDVSGVSKYRGSELSVQEAKADVSGASKAKLTVNQFLEIFASGASSVSYSGEPQVKQNVSGSSRISADN